MNKPSGRGFGLIEVIIAIAISAAAAYYFLVMVPQAKNAVAVAKETENLSIIKQAAQSLYQGSNNYASITDTVLINANVIPSSMISGGQIINSQGQRITVGPASLGGGTNNAFVITETSVINTMCSRLIMSVGNSFDAVQVNGLGIKGYGQTTAIDPTSPDYWCGAWGNGSPIQFYAQ